jgi:Toprim domain/CHC2 zinc finger
MTTMILIEDEIARRGIRLVGRGAERSGPCPVCGGRDRFSINIKKQVWNCRGCGRGGDAIDLVRHLDGVDFRTASGMLGCDEVRLNTKPKVADDDNAAAALRIWDEADIGGALLKSYLQRRGLDELPPGCDALRLHPSCPFVGDRHPCMIALHRDIHTNEPKAITRTALGSGGVKIGRLSLGPIAGCAVKLDPDENVQYGLTIGEGVETALAGMQLGFCPTWALGSAGAIKNFPVLPGIEALTILVDHDEADRNGRRAGQEAAAACSERWTAAGCEVRRVVPRRLGADMADLIGARHEG